MKKLGTTLENVHRIVSIMLICTVIFPSCTILEKASSHGFENGDYIMKQAGIKNKKVYLESYANEIRVYEKDQEGVNPESCIVIPQGKQDSICQIGVTFSKHSLDIDITTVLFKVRPSTSEIPLQLTSDFNAALYSGWRYDIYRVKSESTPLGQCDYHMTNRGFDIGGFAGLGTSPVNPFFTRGKVDREYSAMILQYGVAGFLETSVASFGLSLGADHMVGPDRHQWIYQNKPWIGFIIGIALN